MLFEVDDCRSVNTDYIISLKVQKHYEPRASYEVLLVLKDADNITLYSGDELICKLVYYYYKYLIDFGFSGVNEEYLMSIKKQCLDDIKQKYRVTSGYELRKDCIHDIIDKYRRKIYSDLYKRRSDNER